MLIQHGRTSKTGLKQSIFPVRLKAGGSGGGTLEDADIDAPDQRLGSADMKRGAGMGDMVTHRTCKT